MRALKLPTPSLAYNIQLGKCPAFELDSGWKISGRDADGAHYACGQLLGGLLASLPECECKLQRPQFRRRTDLVLLRSRIYAQVVRRMVCLPFFLVLSCWRERPYAAPEQSQRSRTSSVLLAVLYSMCKYIWGHGPPTQTNMACIAWKESRSLVVPAVSGMRKLLDSIPFSSARHVFCGASSAASSLPRMCRVCLFDSVSVTLLCMSASAGAPQVSVHAAVPLPLPEAQVSRRGFGVPLAATERAARYAPRSRIKHEETRS